MKRTDSHQHFWQLSRGDYSWLTPEAGILYRDFAPADLKGELRAANVTETVLIQAADTLEETEFLLSLADKHEFITGVVGWVDMEQPEVISQLLKLMENPYFKGVRPMVQDIENDNWLLKPELTPVFEFLEEHSLSFDALVLPKHLANLHILLLRHPRLKVVIDHGAKPRIAEALSMPVTQSVNKQWAEDIAQLAKNKNVYCKLSGLVTEAGSEANESIVHLYIKYLYQCFGANKLMWGSDWPVVNLTSDYMTWFDIASGFIEQLPLNEQQSIWSETAEDFYRL